MSARPNSQQAPEQTAPPTGDQAPAAPAVVKCTSETEVLQVLAQLATLSKDARPAVKVVLLGNTGAGKSWLCNALLGCAVFEHLTRAGSVTADVSYACTATRDGTPLVVCDVPGLIEADPANLARNKAAVERVVAGFLPDAPTLCLFVARCAGGRVRQEDVAAVITIRRYLGDTLPPESFAFVTNDVDSDEFDSEAAQVEYEAGVKSLVAKALDAQQHAAPVHWAFIPSVAKKHRADYASAPAAAAQAALLNLVVRMTPRRVAPKPGARVELEEERLAAAAREARAAGEAMEREARENKAAHQAAVAKAAKERRERERQEEEMKNKMEEEKKRRDNARWWGQVGGCVAGAALAAGAAVVLPEAAAVSAGAWLLRAGWVAATTWGGGKAAENMS